MVSTATFRSLAAVVVIAAVSVACSPGESPRSRARTTAQIEADRVSATYDTAAVLCETTYPMFAGNGAPNDPREFAAVSADNAVANGDVSEDDRSEFEAGCIMGVVRATAGS